MSEKVKSILKEIAVTGAVFAVVWFVVSELQIAGQRGGGGALPVGEPAPTFALSEVSTGQTWDLVDLDGKPVILNFWATWCGACRDELPAISALHDEADGRYHVVTVAHQNVRTLQRFVKHRRLSFPVLLDPRGSVHEAYGVHSYPTTVIIDADGRVVHDFVGVASASVLREHMDQLAR